MMTAFFTAAALTRLRLRLASARLRYQGMLNVLMSDEARLPALRRRRLRRSGQDWRCGRRFGGRRHRRRIVAAIAAIGTSPSCCRASACGRGPPPPRPSPAGAGARGRLVGGRWWDRASPKTAPASTRPVQEGGMRRRRSPAHRAGRGRHRARVEDGPRRARLALKVGRTRCADVRGLPSPLRRASRVGPPRRPRDAQRLARASAFPGFSRG